MKRMAASFTIAARNNGFSKGDTRAATLASVAAYREAMASFAQMGPMDIWYAHLDEDELMKGGRGALAGIAKGKKGQRGEFKAGTLRRNLILNTKGLAHTVAADLEDSFLVQGDPLPGRPCRQGSHRQASIWGALGRAARQAP